MPEKPYRNHGYLHRSCHFAHSRGALLYKTAQKPFSKNIYPGNNSPLARTTDSNESLIYGVDFPGLLDTYLPKALDDLKRIYPDTDESIYTEGIKLIDAYRGEIYTILKYDDWAAEIDRPPI